jgi:hypothetical protein
MSINGLRVPDSGQASTPFVVTASNPVATIDVSYEQADASRACATWIQKRKLKFATAAAPQRRSRIKTAGEQASDLARACLTLRHLRESVASGNGFLVGPLAGELRALLYWKNEDRPDRGYNPLLLRMASKADLPLPVYHVGSSDPLPTLGLTLHWRSRPPQILKETAAEKLEDIQDWLSRDALMLGGITQRSISALEIISETANTLGVAHYDEDVSDFVETMQLMHMGHQDDLSRFLCDTSEVVERLSDWVLRELQRRGIIS